MSRPRLSVVVPVYNGADTLEELYRELTAVLAGWELQLIFVDDHSADSSREILARLAKADSRVTVIALARNLGQQEATLRGMQAAAGEYVAHLDDDGQHPPALLPPMLDKLAREGLDLVYAVPQADGREGWRRLGARMRDRLFARLFPMAGEVRVSSFRVMTGALAREVLARRGRFNYFSATALEAGARAGFLTYPYRPRPRGRSGYSPGSLWGLYGKILWYYGLCPRCRTRAADVKRGDAPWRRS